MSLEDIAKRRVPVDATAARVTSRGVEYVSTKEPGCAYFDAPVPIRPLAPDQQDLAGRRFGHFTVVGYFGPGSKHHNGGRWQVRCVCGMYSLRYAKAIKNPKNTQDACERCRHLQHLRTRTQEHP